MVSSGERLEKVKNYEKLDPVCIYVFNNLHFLGDDQGCQYFLKADSIPLKMSTTPNEDGSTKLSYYTKNTIGSKFGKSTKIYKRN
jgi:hypothetical protein